MRKCTCGAHHTSNPDHHSEWCDGYEDKEETCLEYLHAYLVELKKRHPLLEDVVVTYPILEYSRRLMGEKKGTSLFIHHATQLRLRLKNEVYVNWTRLEIEDLMTYGRTKKVQYYKR